MRAGLWLTACKRGHETARRVLTLVCGAKPAWGKDGHAQGTIHYATTGRNYIATSPRLVSMTARVIGSDGVLQACRKPM